METTSNLSGDSLRLEAPAGTSNAPEEERRPPDAPAELLVQLASDAPDAVRRKAYSQLARLGRSDRGLFGRLVVALTSSDPLTIRWAISELYWSTPLEDRDSAVEVHLASVLPEDATEVAARVLRSRWVTREHEPVPFPSPLPHTRLDLHPLLEVDGDGSWPAARDSIPADAQLFSGDVDESLPALASLDLPIARELMARRGLLLVRQPRYDIDTMDSRLLKVTVKVLEATIPDLERLFRAESLVPSAVEEVLALPRLAGRSADLWGKLDRQRVKVVKLAPCDAERAEVWARAVVAMPSTSSGVLTALRDVPDASLLALLDLCLAHDMTGFVGAIQDIALQRARNGHAGPHFWLRLGEIAPTSHKLERWWRNVMAPLAPEGSVALDERTTVELLASTVQSATDDDLCGTELLGRIRVLPPTDRFRLVLRMLGQLRKAVKQARDRAVERVTHELRSEMQRAVTVRADLLQLLGAMPPDLIAIAETAVAAIATDIEAIERISMGAPSDDRTAMIARKCTDLPDLLAALRAVDRIRDESEQARALSRLREHMAWAAAESRHVLDHIAAELQTLSPEAVGAVLSVAVSHRVSSLLGAVSGALDTSRAVQVVWRAALVAHASTSKEDLPVSEILAGLSAELLEPEIGSAQEDLKSWRSLRPLKQYRAGSREAVSAFRDRMQHALEQFGRIVREF
jgi:hypothetical protein